jgi:hypothetical protein
MTRDSAPHAEAQRVVSVLAHFPGGSVGFAIIPHILSRDLISE